MKGRETRMSDIASLSRDAEAGTKQNMNVIQLQFVVAH
jgi:hypothetical protein